MSWLKKLQLAVINEDVDQVVELYEQMPVFEDTESAKIASAIILSAIVLLENEKTKSATVLKRIETIKKYGVGFVGHPSINQLS